MSARRSLVWLGLTPEPEQELPTAVAALRSPAGDRPPAALVAAEQHRVERLVLRGTQRGWLRYLGEVTALVVEAAAGSGAGDPRPALVAGEVVLDHHRMLIGLPGAGYAHTAPQRRELEQGLARLRSRPRTGRSDDNTGVSGHVDLSDHSDLSAHAGPSGDSSPSGPADPSGTSGPSGGSPSGHPDPRSTA